MEIVWLFHLCFNFLLFHFSFSHSFCHPHDNFALLHFKASLTIHTTMNGYYADECHQVYPTIATWENGTDCCSWSGVTCHSISGHVTAIDLTCDGLQGKINANNTLFSLSHLQSLNLAFNDFSNSHIPCPSCSSASLNVLQISFCKFQGSIPPSFSNLTSLTLLDLSHNYLNGSIPSSLLTLPRLKGVARGDELILIPLNS